MENKQDKLDQFIATVADLVEKGRENECTEEALQKMAKEMGLTATEWDSILQEFEEYCIRAENYIGYKQWEKAIEQCSSALQIKPVDKRALLLMTKANLLLWKKAATAEYLDATEYYAEKLIYHYPSDKEAYHLLRQTKSRFNWNTVLIAVSLMLLGVSAVFYFLRKAEPSQQSVEKKIISENKEDTADSTLILSQTDWKLYTLDFDTSAFEFKLFDARLEKYNQQGMAIYCRADILIKNYEMHDLAFEINVLDGNGQIIDTLSEPVLHYQPAALPGDVMPFDFLFYDSVMPVFPLSLLIVPVTLNFRPLASYYSEPKPLEIKNAAEFSSYQLKISERRSIFEVQELMNQTMHKLSLLVENMGPNDVEKLRIKIIWTIDESKVIAEKNVWINISDMPPIQSGQRRFFFTIETFDFKKTSEKIDYSILFEQIE